MVLAGYIQPKTPTNKKDLVNIFVLIAAGVVGSLTAIAAVGNLIVSRKNLQQQHDLDERHAQDDALQAYYEQMGDLLTEHKLMETKDENDPIRLLARAQTSTLLERLGSESSRAKRKKGELVRFLHDAGLINKGKKIVMLSGADLKGVDLRGADLSSADLSGADLSGADLTEIDLRDADLSHTVLSGADLNGADLSGANLSRAMLMVAQLMVAYLRGANFSSANFSGASLNDAYLLDASLNDAYLRGADLSGADLTSADLTDAIVDYEQLSSCTLNGATMPDGQKYEESFKDR